MKLMLKACPKCGGAVTKEDRDDEGSLSCINCGWHPVVKVESRVRKRTLHNGVRIS